MTTNRKRKGTRKANAYELGDDLVIIKTSRRAAAGGTWVYGTIAGYRFDALGFPGTCRMPGLRVGRQPHLEALDCPAQDKETVFNWDRGMDIPAASAKTQAVVDFLADGLAEHIYHN